MSWRSLRQTPVSMVSLLIDWGWKLSNADAPKIMAYFRKMIAEERMVMIREEEEIIAFCTFFLVWRMSDVELLYSRRIWDLPYIGYGTGSIGYIDKIAARMPWTKSLRKKVESVILARYPMVDTWVWYRPSRGNDPDHRLVRPARKEVEYGRT